MRQTIISTLYSPPVASALEHLHAKADSEDRPVKRRIRAREAEIGRRLSQAERYELYGQAPQAISRERSANCSTSWRSAAPIG